MMKPNNNIKGSRWFYLGGILSLAVALMHVVIIFAGAPLYRYFGAGEEMAALAEGGSLLPALITLGIVAVFCVFGAYALSAAGMIRRLPWLKAIVILITAIYVLRGTGFFIEILGIVYGYEVPVRHAVFSLVALVTGLIHLTGLVKGWKHLGASTN